MNYDALVQSIVTLHREALGRAALAVNRVLVLRNWMIGAYLVEFEQDGADRAAYGTGLLSRLARDLRQHDIKGVSPDVLERMRLLYLHYPQSRTHISATASRNSPVASALEHSSPISATPSRKSAATDPTPLSAEHLLPLGGLAELRAGAAGLLGLVLCSVDASSDPLFAPACRWASVTDYQTTRYAKRTTPEQVLVTDLQAELQRRGLPVPESIQTVKLHEGLRGGVNGLLCVNFAVAVAGPVLIGRSRHLGGGLFAGAA